MPRYRRYYVPGGTYFFTVNLLDRQSGLLTDKIDRLRAAYKFACQRHPFETIAICVLPDHIHCVWTLPKDDHDFSRRWRVIKTAFTKSIPKSEDEKPGRRKGERGIWQRRFWEHAIRDENDLETHINYIHYNPVKHGFVNDMDDWPWSSWHRYKRVSGKVWLPPKESLIAGER